MPPKGTLYEAVWSKSNMQIFAVAVQQKIKIKDDTNVGAEFVPWSNRMCVFSAEQLSEVIPT